jgi:hypothetical protein
VCLCHSVTAQWLIGIGAGVNVPGKGGNTALVVASGMGHLLAVHTLLLWGADPSLGLRGRTPAMLAKAKGHDGVVKLLDAWTPIRAMWTVRSAVEVRGSLRSELVRYPKDMCRMLGKFLV